MKRKIAFCYRHYISTFNNFPYCNCKYMPTQNRFGIAEEDQVIIFVGGWSNTSLRQP